MVSMSVDGLRAANTTPKNNGLSLEEIGASGLKQYGGYIREEFQKNLMGPKAALVYREMSWNDPMVAASVRAIDMIIRQVQWSVEVDSPDTEPTEQDKKAAQFVEECLHDLDRPWVEIVSEIMTMVVYGWEWSELTFKKRDGFKPGLGASGNVNGSRFDDGKWGWSKIAGRAQTSLYRWEFDESGDVLGMWQLRPDTWENVFIPAWKSLHFRTSSHFNNPEGFSLLRSAYWPWYFKKHIEEIRAIGIERDLAGLPVAWLDVSYFQDNLTPDKQAVFTYMKKLVSNIKRDEQEGVLMPLSYDQEGNKMVDLQLLASAGSRQMAIDTTIDYYDQKITQGMYTDWLLLGHEAVGSRALSTNKTDMFSTIIGALMDNVCAPINNAGIPQLMEVNGIKTDHPIKLKHGDIDIRDGSALSTMLLNLANAGLPLFGTEAGLRIANALLKDSKLPTIPEDSWDEVLQPDEPLPEDGPPASQDDPDVPVPGAGTATTRNARPRKPRQPKPAGQTKPDKPAS